MRSFLRKTLSQWRASGQYLDKEACLPWIPRHSKGKNGVAILMPIFCHAKFLSSQWSLSKPWGYIISSSHLNEGGHWARGASQLQSSQLEGREGPGS